MSKIIEGVFIQTVENKKVENKYVSLKDVSYKGTSLGTYLEKTEEIQQAQTSRIDALNKEISNLRTVINQYQDSVKQALAVITEKIEEEKFL